MTTMKISELVAVGMNRNEAAVYLALVESGQATAREITAKTKFHKNIVYDNLNKLADKGLISQVVSDGATLFSLANATALTDYAAQQLAQSQEISSLATSLQKKINAVQARTPRKVSTELFVGVQAIRSFFEKTLSDGDYCVIGAPQASVDIMGTTFWQNYNIKKIERRNTARIVFNESLRAFAKIVADKFTIIRFLPTVAEPLSEIHISDSYVAIIIWTKEPSLTLINDKEAAKGYQEYFELLWSISKK